MQKLTTGNDTTRTVEYKANVKQSAAPKVVEQYTNDEGELMYILDNSRETLADKYNSIWNPTKGVIMPSTYKGENKDGRKIA